MFIEISKQAFDVLIADRTWPERLIKPESSDQRILDNAEIVSVKVIYENHGVQIQSIYNYVSDVEQYYMMDINA